jgi:hypothetical protein
MGRCACSGAGPLATLGAAAGNKGNGSWPSIDAMRAFALSRDDRGWTGSREASERAVPGEVEATPRLISAARLEFPIHRDKSSIGGPRKRSVACRIIRVLCEVVERKSIRRNRFNSTSILATIY